MLKNDTDYTSEIIFLAFERPARAFSNDAGVVRKWLRIWYIQVAVIALSAMAVAVGGLRLQRHVIAPSQGQGQDRQDPSGLIGQSWTPPGLNNWIGGC